MKVKVESIRKIPNPYAGLEQGIKEAEMYIAIADIKELPDDIPMGTNPREQNLRTTVSRKIRESLLSPDELDFYLLNRGMLLSASDVSFNNYTNELTIGFDDHKYHGNIDGGHTYKIIKQVRGSLEKNRQFVKLEILTGVEEIFERLAGARNTSVQVHDKSIAELENRFELIKSSIANEPYSEKVYFKENETGEIDVSDILTILNLFNIDRYKEREKFPINSYSSKKSCVDIYINEHKKSQKSKDYSSNPYYKMETIIVDIFKLYDEVESRMGEFYKEANSKGAYGRVKGVMIPKEKNTFKSKFYKKKMDYSSPKGFIYPILGAFRALVAEDKNGKYYWKQDPFKVLDKVGAILVDGTVEMSRDLGNNPNAVGKNMSNWRNLYMTVGYEAK